MTQSSKILDQISLQPWKIFLENWSSWKSYAIELTVHQQLITWNMVCNIIQLLTVDVLDMMWYPPVNTNIDQWVVGLADGAG